MKTEYDGPFRSVLFAVIYVCPAMAVVVVAGVGVIVVVAVAVVVVVAERLIKILLP